MTNHQLAVAILERIGERLAKRGDLDTTSDLMFAAALVRRPDTKTTPAGGGVKHRQSRSGSAPCQSPDRLAHVTGLKQ